MSGFQIYIAKSKKGSNVGDWEPPGGSHPKSWRRKNPSGQGYEYRSEKPGSDEAKKEESEPQESGGLLKPGGGPGIFGMTKAQVEAKIAASSAAGHNQEPIAKTGTKQAWIDCWAELFPFGTEADMNRVPDGNVDPATAIFTWSRISDPHTQSFLRYKSKKGKTQTCNTVENLVQNDVVHWAHVRGLMGSTNSGEEILEVLSGKGERPKDENLAKIYDLSGSLKDIWSDSSKSTRERDSAAINTLIMESGKRRGQIGNYRSTGNRGMTTLHAGDVTIDGDTIRLRFKGKNGKINTGAVVNPELARYMAERKEAAGSGKNIRIFDASDTSVGEALQAAGSPTTKPKDFRTLVATAHAMIAFRKAAAPRVKIKGKMTRVRNALDKGLITKKKALKTIADTILDVCKTVQKKLDHSGPGMTRDNYIHPEVFQQYLEKHNVADLIPKQLNPYAKHARSGSPAKKSLIGSLSGFSVIVKAEDSGEVEDPTRSDEEDVYHWPSWILQYGFTEEERKRLRAGEEINKGEVLKGFGVFVHGVAENFTKPTL